MIDAAEGGVCYYRLALVAGETETLENLGEAVVGQQSYEQAGNRPLRPD